MSQNTATKNNIKLATRLSGRCKYAFVDSAEHRADRILIGALLPVSFEKGVSGPVGGGFELRVCSFERKYESWFLTCMDDLKWVLEGEEYEGYEQACELLLGTGAAA